jgi:YVTN family beta-propeller protein
MEAMRVQEKIGGFMVRRYCARLIYLFILLALPVAASTIRVFVCNEGGDSVDVIDPVTNKVVQTIKGLGVPTGVVFSPDGRRAYISDEQNGVFNVVDTKTGENVNKIGLSGLPALAAITKDGKRIFVSVNRPGGNDATPGAVDIIDTATSQKLKTIPMKYRMHDLYLTADEKYAFAGSPKGLVTVIDTGSGEIAWDISFESGILSMAMESNADGSTSRIFVLLQGLNGFAVVDFAKKKEVARIEFPAGEFYNVTTKPASSRIPTHGSAITPDGKTLWVCSRGYNAVFVYSLPELKLVGQIPMPQINVPGNPVLGVDPHWVTFTPDSKTAYVSLAAFKSVSAIDVKSMKEVTRIPVGEDPRRIGPVALP